MSKHHGPRYTSLVHVSSWPIQIFLLRITSCYAARFLSPSCYYSIPICVVVWTQDFVSLPDPYSMCCCLISTPLCWPNPCPQHPYLIPIPLFHCLISIRHIPGWSPLCCYQSPVTFATWSIPWCHSWCSVPHVTTWTLYPYLITILMWLLDLRWLCRYSIPFLYIAIWSLFPLLLFDVHPLCYSIPVPHVATWSLFLALLSNSCYCLISGTQVASGSHALLVHISWIAQSLCLAFLLDFWHLTCIAP